MRKRSFAILLTLTLLILQLTIANSLEITEGAATQGEIKLSGDERVVCLLVASNVYEPLKPYLERWMDDVRKEGYEPTLKVITNETPQQIRQMLKETPNLKGALLVGNIPTVEYEMDWIHPIEGRICETFPCDLFFMDLDGYWGDNDGDNILDSHSGDVHPEIWIGRLKPPSESLSKRIKLLKTYFNKDHLYRIGASSLPYRALIYVDDVFSRDDFDWLAQAYQIDAMLGRLYTDRVIVVDPKETCASDYLNRLSEGWSYVFVHVHGWPYQQCFKINGTWDGTVNSEDIRNLNPRSFFFSIISCTAARYTVQDYIGGWYIFSIYGLVVVGSTKTGVAGPIENYLQHAPIGLAFLRLIQAHIQAHENPGWYYGMTILGDPLLRPVYNGVDEDGDCLADWFELENGLDPGNPDSDGDGLTDYEELIYEADPLNPDSDRDGLPDSEEIRLDGNPLDPDTDDDGLTDGEEYHLGTAINASDSDFDGLLDGEEVEIGTDPLNGDTDGDYLCDGEEVELGTSPTNSDTDGDGLTDYAETFKGTNPLSKDTDKDYWNDYVDPDPLNALIPNVTPIIEVTAVIIGLIAVASKISRTPGRERG